jgi:hypothetical protein
MPSSATIGGMVELAIRCHRCAPVPHEELERWLERHVGELRAAIPHATCRLSRLTLGGPTADPDIGWLVELELAEGEPLLQDEQLATSLRDMRLLGLEPTLLAAHAPWTNGSAA